MPSARVLCLMSDVPLMCRNGFAHFSASSYHARLSGPGRCEASGIPTLALPGFCILNCSHHETAECLLLAVLRTQVFQIPHIKACTWTPKLCKRIAKCLSILAPNAIILHTFVPCPGPPRAPLAQRPSVVGLLGSKNHRKQGSWTLSEPHLLGGHSGI